MLEGLFMVKLNDIKEEFDSIRDQRRALRQKRNELVVALYEQGYSLTEIANLSNISVRICHYIVNNN